MRGRIMGLYTVMSMGMTPPGATVTGTLANTWGIGTALAIEATVCALVMALGLGYLAWARRRSHPEEAEAVASTGALAG
jgi:uncharacterized iron-regulated membrane protein